MNLIYKEKTVLNKFLTENDCEIKLDKLIPILIKYYYINGITDKLELRELILQKLYEFNELNTRDSWTNKVKKSIEEFFKYLRKGNLLLEIVEVESVVIYKEELDIISTVDQPKFRKFLFTLLVWSKVYKQFNRNTIVENVRELLTLSKCECGNANYRNLMLHKLKDSELIWTKMTNSAVHKISVKIEKDEGEVAFVVRDFENAIYQYLIYIGENWKQCECGKYFKYLKSKPKQKYCKDCSKEKQKEQQRASMKKIRGHLNVK